ncbi:glycoside hydrolase family 15 protein [Thiotrichales bacterium 19S3-7]|nr:glycoside hydrolase family 15 protein [Thiotrichales bacterium 19S3-7]MCF6801201.1 glycoside hydrolase family 15 protein [Thiotrichales bacterium 19S3-11]
MQQSKLIDYLNKDYCCYQSQAPESDQPIYYYYDELKPFLEAPLTAEMAQSILDKFQLSFAIELNEQGFAQAAERQSNNDQSHYDAVWIRDNVWVYFYFKTFNPSKAKILIESLSQYYLNPDQLKRFECIIDQPSRASDSMQVPHIRFNGKSDTYQDVQIDGHNQIWNHKQLDAHGLFLIALYDAINSNLIDYQSTKKDINQLVNYFFNFFNAIDFSNYEDAGAWEEIERVNTSSIALVTNAAFKWLKLKQKYNITLNCDLNQLAHKGLEKVKQQISFGGESPNYPIKSIQYRRSDAALLHVITPYLLEELDIRYYEEILKLIQPLERAHGIIRYSKDSYQCANFWLAANDEDLHQLTDDTSNERSFTQRQKMMQPNSEAQWFFDSLIALSYLSIYQHYPVRYDHQSIKLKSAWHIKRALAQMTGTNSLSADGQPLKHGQLPESINTILLDQKYYYLPSPITPLNWAKASLALALSNYAKIFNY